MQLERSSGILLHITSLPSPFGIGDLGPAAYEFVNFLKDSGHQYWQLLPLNPTDEKFSHSPYSSFSAFAGNPLLISPQLLEKEEYVDLKHFPAPKKIAEEKVHFQAVEKYKEALLEAAFQNFKKKNKKSGKFSAFCKKHASWLDDYSLYRVLRKEYHSGWTSWPADLRDRKKAAIKKAEKVHSTAIEKEKFIQFLFFSQWQNLTEYAHSESVTFIGDIPFYVNHESADCWANPGYFKLDNEKQPTKVSGVPPDYFSETGQLWGTPVFDWKALKTDNFDWWVKRIEQNLLLFDVVRLDHFRAFSAYWEVGAGEETAINGKWVKTPGAAFFKQVKKEFPKMPFIAEDLGLMDDAVYELINEYEFPGMKVLQFAFGDDRSGNPYLPFNHIPYCIAYTGTHDNNTTRGWFENLGKTEKKHFQDYSEKRVTKQNVHKVLHRMVLNSVAQLAVVPLQDIIGLGEEAIMNTPGTTEGNWSWRVKKEDIPFKKTAELKKLNELYGRINGKEKDSERGFENELEE